MIKLVIFDLDGTLIDVCEIYYRSIKESLEEFDLLCPSQEELIEMKRKGLSGREILGSIIPNIENKDKIIQFCEKNRLKLLNKYYYTKSSKLYPNVKEILRKLKEMNIKIAIVTLHSSTKLIENNLKKIGIFEYVDIIVANNDGNDHKKIKFNLFKKIIHELDIRPEECYVVGDSIYEIEAGNNIKAKTIGVSYGLSNENVLYSKKPFKIVSDIKEILDIIINE